MLCCVFGPGYRGERGCCGTLWQDGTFSGVGVLSAVEIEVAVDVNGGWGYWAVVPLYLEEGWILFELRGAVSYSDRCDLHDHCDIHVVNNGSNGGASAVTTSKPIALQYEGLTPCCFQLSPSERHR